MMVPAMVMMEMPAELLGSAKFAGVISPPLRMIDPVDVGFMFANLHSWISANGTVAHNRESHMLDQRPNTVRGRCRCWTWFRLTKCRNRECQRQYRRYQKFLHDAPLDIPTGVDCG